MKLWLTQSRVPWDTERFHYAVEQMMMTLFPGEKPEYPQTPPPEAEFAESSAIFTLERENDRAAMNVTVFWNGKIQKARLDFPAEELDRPAEAVYRTLQTAIKQAFYQAGIALLGRELPWGSITGVRPVKLPARAILAGEPPEQAEALLRDTYHVAPIRRELAMDCAFESVNATRSLAPDEVSLYIGIPFCPSRCVYCSFISAAVGQCLKLVEPFVDALCREIEATGRLLRETERCVRTVYMGGGTPTTLSAEQMERVLSAVETHIDLSRCTEFTVEAGRPDTITPEKLAVLARHKIGRVSVNPQSMCDEVLKRMGRPHTGEDIRRAYGEVRAAGDFLVNMDLIAGLPGDSPDSFARSLNEVISMAPENITVHTLALKKGARLAENPEILPTDRQVEDMLDKAWNALRAAGYAPYYLYRQKYMSGSFENVGWAKPNCVSLYNIAMMEELHTILALGGGGVTKLVTPGTGKIERLANPKYPQEYLRDIDKLLENKTALAPFLRETRNGSFKIKEN